ncbi:MAG: hypothetical protein WC784_03635 [Candidatus Shapirobacteria bacterium]|jgi:hypothetical protein
MKEEIALSTINNLAFGNERMREVLSMVYRGGKTIVDEWPDEKTAMLARKMIRATSCLIHRRINFEELAIKGDKFWESEKGKSVDTALTNFIEARRNKTLTCKSL